MAPRGPVDLDETPHLVAYLLARGVGAHRIAHPADRGALRPYLLDDGGQQVAHPVRAHRRHQRQPFRRPVRIEPVHGGEHRVRAGAGPEPDGDGVVDRGEVTGVVSARFVGLPQPQQVPRRGVRDVVARFRVRLGDGERPLVVEQQALVPGEELRWCADSAPVEAVGPQEVRTPADLGQRSPSCRAPVSEAAAWSSFQAWIRRGPGRDRRWHRRRSPCLGAVGADAGGVGHGRSSPPPVSGAWGSVPPAGPRSGPSPSPAGRRGRSGHRAA